MEAAGESPQEEPQPEVQESPQPGHPRSEDRAPEWIEPDLAFIRALRGAGGDALKKCIQCGTCSATCTISPDAEPFPRKEMAWASWGMKDRLLKDPDIWLCHQCNDCSTRCPRGARPGGVLAAARSECVRQYAFPRFLARWLNEPFCIPLLLGIPAALFALALFLKGPIERALGIERQAADRILFSYSSAFPHWMLNSIFGFFSILILISVVISVRRHWRAMKAANPHGRNTPPAKGIGASVLTALRSVFTHEKFTMCTSSRPRYASHMCVFFGFLALTLVTLWVITAKHNPIIQDSFVYPFGFWHPWKMLANLGGMALMVGCLLMAGERLRGDEKIGAGAYSDWALITMLLLVVMTGFITEILHFLRLEPHRHVSYFVHLTFAFAVLMYLPYSKLAHLFYRFAAIVFAEHSGRNGEAPPPPNQAPAGEKEG